MKFQQHIILCIFLAYLGAMAQEKREVKPYSISTTYEKLKKDYPFVQPIETLTSGKIKTLENVVYKTVSGKDLKADVYIPDTGAEKYPAVLLIHGGGWLTGSKENQRVMAQHLANNGYVAVTATYRLGTEARYPAGVEDLIDALKWMRENSDKCQVNTAEIAVLGASAGAQLATLLGVADKSIKAIVNIDGIVSFIHPDAEEGWMAATWLGGEKEEKNDVWKEASPLEYVNENTPPTLFINSSFPRFHAGRDDMLKILDEHSIYNEVHTIQDSPHSFWLMHPWFDETLDLTLSFLDKTLKKSLKAQPYREITVSKDSKGDFESIQEAINSTRDLGPGEVRIHIKNGTYNEKIEIPSWKHKLTLVGESKEGVVILNDDYSGKMNPQTGKKFSTFTSYTVLVQGNDIKIENLTIKNSWCEKGQAVALHVEGDRFVAKNCNIMGCQDTIYTAKEGSRQFYLNCFIEGTTDFIFGEATAVFKNCTIKSLKNSFITAAATPENQEFGYVFFNCKLIAAGDVDEVYLGRPWRSYARTVFIHSELGAHIVPAGWDPWTGDNMFPNKERTTYYAEYNSSGPGASTKTRVEWSHQLTEQETEKYTLKNIFDDDWFWASKEIKNKLYNEN
ncbi:pectinesterase family protein [Gillisia sp. M10.2A]|uniref:Pectinesterase n=1 Tax=Gillisia lutea TaxID=2909668 RepID=A0ABS9EI06_9FLAO|nr:pectinesterase family protein [Gillisia lutea]MCF4101073.1 pectinesterase family protein [Gillisia lutea]